MYNLKKKSYSEKFFNIVNWIKRRIIIIIAGVMIGISNAIYEEDNMINKNHKQTEKFQKKDKLK